LTWPVRKIDDVAVFLNSRRVPVKAADRAKRQGPYPYYGASGIVDWVDGYIFDGEYLLISEDGENLRSRNTPIAFLAHGKYWVNNHAHILDEREPGILRYLSWALNRTDLSPYITGAAQPKLNKRTLSNVEIPIPPMAERLEINAVLGALDDKIELNRRMSATLEEMARALYRSWFVDFDPVRARAHGQPPAHMDAPTAALFPESFGADGLPMGWEMSTIGEVAETVGGATPKTQEPTFWDGPHRWATPRDLSKLGQPVLFETERTLSNSGLATISSGLSPAGTVLLSSRAPIGYVAIAQNPVAVNQGFIALRETDQISSVEAYFWVQSNMDAILANANGSTFQEISKKNFRPLPCVVAPEAVRSAFRDLAGTWFNRVAGLCAENAKLAALRDTLLPRLMSGELRIRAAERLAEEVA